MFIDFLSLFHISLYNTLWPRQEGRDFPDDIFICTFLNENEWHSIKISLKVPINNIPALVQITATGHYLNQWWLFYRRTYASLGLNWLIYCNHTWGNTYKTNLSKLQILKNRVLRIITGSKPRCHVDPLYNKLGFFLICLRLMYL